MGNCRSKNRNFNLGKYIASLTTNIFFCDSKYFSDRLGQDYDTSYAATSGFGQQLGLGGLGLAGAGGGRIVTHDTCYMTRDT